MNIGQMFLSTISLVFFETVIGILLGEFAHEIVTMSLGQYRSGSNTSLATITTDDSALIMRQLRYRQATVNKDYLRRHTQGGNSLTHG